MTAYDIFILINSNVNGHIQSTIEDVSELISEIHNNPAEFCNSLHEIINEYAVTHHVCPTCGERLNITKQWKEDRGEYFGSPVYESYSSSGCPYCN